MRSRYTEDWPTDGYQPLTPVATGEGHSARWVMPIEVSFSGLMQEAVNQIFVIVLVCIAAVFIASALGLNHGGLAGLKAAFVGFALWKLWECWNIPQRERIIATREGNELVIAYSSKRSHEIRVDLSAARYAWLERQLRGGPAGWTLHFGTTPDDFNLALDLRLLGISEEKQRPIYDALLHGLIVRAFEHIEIIAVSGAVSTAERSDAADRSQREDVSVHVAGADPIGKTQPE